MRPLRLVRITSSNWSSFMRTIRPSRVMPALLTRTNGTPISSLNFLERGAAGVIVRNIPLLHISVNAVRGTSPPQPHSLFDRGRNN